MQHFEIGNVPSALVQTVDHCKSRGAYCLTVSPWWAWGHPRPAPIFLLCHVLLLLLVSLCVSCPSGRTCHSGETEPRDTRTASLPDCISALLSSRGLPFICAMANPLLSEPCNRKWVLKPNAERDSLCLFTFAGPKTHARSHRHILEDASVSPNIPTPCKKQNIHQDIFKLKF